MLKTEFDREEFSYFSNHQKTPLHCASWHGDLDIIKYLVEKGADVNSVWNQRSLNYKMNVLTLINNFNDPFYLRFEDLDEIISSQMNTLIENGMI